MMENSILVTGGAGFIGCAVVAELLRAGRKVTIIDSLKHGDRGILPFFANRGFDCLKADVRNAAVLRVALQKASAIIHLAAIVGAPACDREPEESDDVNVGATILLNKLRGSKPLIFASTQSVYGVVKTGICTEESAIAPLSRYAAGKARAETEIMQAGNAIIYRLATAFGISNRLRLDVLPNDLCRQAVTKRELSIYEGQSRRAFIHVRDIAAAFLHGLNNFGQMRDGIYNLGDETMTCTKIELAEKIRRRCAFGVGLRLDHAGEDPDRRDYEVSFAKLRQTGYRTSITLEEGLDEVIRAIAVVSTPTESTNAPEA